MKRTDLAMELTDSTSRETAADGVKRSDVTVDARLARTLGKPEGTYCTVESGAVREGRRDRFPALERELGDALTELIACARRSCGLSALPDGKDFTALTVGLGNPNMTADSLGNLVARRLMITRHLGGSSAKLCCLAPNVLGVTGIESFDVVAGVCARVRPDVVIAVDSLAGAAVSRIASAFQVTSAGITPGSGVSNHRARLDFESLGVPVVSMGVPLVVYASTIIQDALGRQTEYDDEIGSLVVTPKDIDVYVEDCAEIVAAAVNGAFFGFDDPE